MSITHFSSAVSAAAASTAAEVSLTNRTVGNSVTHPADAIAGLIFSPNGQFSVLQGSTTTDIANQWALNLQPNVGVGFEIQFTTAGLTGVTLSGDATDVWLSMSQVRQITATRTGVGVGGGTISVSIRTVGPQVVVANATFTISVDKSALIQSDWPALALDDVTSGNARAGVQLTNNGAGLTVGNGGSVFNWATPTTTNVGASYDVRATLVSGIAGNVEGPTLGANVWHNLSNTRLWVVNRSVTGTTTVTINLTIRDAVSQLQIVSKNITLTANVGVPN